MLYSICGVLFLVMFFVCMHISEKNLDIFKKNLFGVLGCVFLFFSMTAMVVELEQRIQNRKFEHKVQFFIACQDTGLTFEECNFQYFKYH